MIASIEPPNPNIMKAVSYNEKKMDGTEGIREHKNDKSVEMIENGHVLATRNVPEGSTMTQEFERLKILHMKKQITSRLVNQTFHMSINPSETDRELSEEEAVQFIDEVMEGLGYKDQPYRIYKHTDIDRMHYHVVSSRAGQNGKKIPDSFERLVLRQTLKQLAPKYGFTVILNEKEKAAAEREEMKHSGEEPIPMPEIPIPPAKTETKEKAKEKKTEDKKKVVPAFSRKSSTPVTRQITDAFEDAMKWNFSTFEQLQGLMLRRYNILLEIERGENTDQDHIIASGTTASGERITPMLKESDLGVRMLERIREKCENANMAARREQRQRLEKLARAAAEVSSTYEEFRSIMERKGTYVVLSWTKDGAPFGVTYLDRATKCAWKGSETAADFKWLKGVAEKKGWTFTHDRLQQAIEKRSRMPSRKRSLVLRKDPPGVAVEPTRQDRSQAAAILKGLSKIRGGHHTQGSSSGRGRGRDIWEEALEAAAREEVERRQNDNQGQGIN